jgi:GNAT superfamily N-acetyltransferase
MSTPRELAVQGRHAEHALICDRIEPWAYGTHVRASHNPTDVDFNCLRVEHGEPSAQELLDAAEELLGDLSHRKVEIEDEALGERLRPAFDAAGWETSRVLFQIIQGEPDAPEGEFEEVAYAGVRELRREWQHTPAAELPAFEEVVERMGCRTFIARRDGRPVAFVLFNANDVWQVYTSPGARGQGLARMLVGAAVRAAYAGGAEHLLIAADDEGSPKELYRRIGFRPAWTWWEFTRKPREAAK